MLWKPLQIVLARILVCLLVVPFLSAALAYAAPAPTPRSVEAQRAYDDLVAYYRENKKTPPYAQAITDLGSKDARVRATAGKYLLALLKQSRADELDGRSPVRLSPFWGEGATRDAREIRNVIIGAMAVGAQGTEALEVVPWLLESEPSAAGPDAAARILTRTRGPVADDLIRFIIRKGPPVQSALVLALQAAATRKLTDLDADILVLCRHHRAAVRKQAVATGRALGTEGVARVPTFQPEDAFPPAAGTGRPSRAQRDLAAQMEAILQMVITPVPKGATFCWFRFPSGAVVNNVPEMTTLRGWRLEAREGRVRVLDVFGRDAWLADKGMTVHPTSLSEEARRLVGIRKALADPKVDSKRQGELMSSLSRLGMLTGQFQARGLGTPELLVAAWLYQRGERRAAAELLLPRLDALEDDRWLTLIAREQLGNEYHQDMLLAFSHRRDYGYALAQARNLSKDVFKGFGYQRRAIELARQLESRGADFKAFRLPDPSEWKAMRARMTRAAQVRYLADRLRLLNCIQWGQPGGVSFSDPQFGKPHGDSGSSSAPVVNPYQELLGMKLSRAELVDLVPYLADESFMPTFSYWRDFHPQRHLYQVNEVVAELFNAVAKKTVVRLGAWYKLDEAGRKRYLEKVVEWTKGGEGPTSLRV